MGSYIQSQAWLFQATYPTRTRRKGEGMESTQLSAWMLILTRDNIMHDHLCACCIHGFGGRHVIDAKSGVAN